MMNAIYDVLGVPFGIILKLIFDAVNNYGLALILFTLFARLLMLPTSIYQTKGTVKTQRLQPKLRRINNKFKGDQKRIQEETQALYQREGHNPMNMGCMPLLLQFVVIFGLIGVIYKPLTYALSVPDDVINTLYEGAKKLLGGTVPAQQERTIQLYMIDNIEKIASVVNVPEAWYKTISEFNFTFLGIPLGQTPSMKEPSVMWLIPILSGVTSLGTSLFTQIKQKQTNPEMGKNPAMGCMTFGMPLFSVYFTFQFPMGIGIYWIASNIFAFIQTVILSYTHSPKKMVAKMMVDETVQRRSREENLKRAAQKINEE
ncbi:MAG: YidC/Oxa1 family membrane protein insertase [Clostridia bacterium]|nr:YidC/Oxa1 family membrane protein insertase [Clostridia bacterium]